MIKSFTAHTNEIDVVEDAVAEVLAQLSLDGKLQKYTVGFISCFSEFIDSGVVAALSKALPFDVIGTTTLASYNQGSEGCMSLTLSVITSDDMEISVGLSEDLDSNDYDKLKTAYDAAAARLTSKPKLMISFAPLLMNVGGDEFAATFDAITGGVPNFGTISVDHTDDYEFAQILHNGSAYKTRYAFALLAGSIEPRISIATIPPAKIGQRSALVTASIGNQMQEVDGMSAREYLASVGLLTADGDMFTGMNTFPFVIDYNDGSFPVIRVAFALTPDGSAVCGGNIPVGSSIHIGKIDGDDVVQTTENVLKDTIANGNYGYAMMFSCVGRYLCMGYEPEREADAVRGILDEAGISYHLTYSGGELCPIADKDSGGRLSNRVHNDTFVVCLI
ncbi:MAG: FIST C-terminal domain-containing protein [Oscillospiraceae bacterium]|nr:FIST C-terminal domain-containing protein [Oscillospiraceae bacterium]